MLFKLNKVGQQVELWFHVVLYQCDKPSYIEYMSMNVVTWGNFCGLSCIHLRQWGDASLGRPTSNSIRGVKLTSSSYIAHLWGMAQQEVRRIWEEAGDRAKAKILKKWGQFQVQIPDDMISLGCGSITWVPRRLIALTWRCVEFIDWMVESKWRPAMGAVYWHLSWMSGHISSLSQRTPSIP